MSLEISREERVLRLTLNRPEKRNALSADLCRDLLAAVHNASDDSGVGAILVEAKGDFFCTGMDLDEALESSNSEDLNQLHRELFHIRSTSRKPIVVAVGGPALGGGLGLIANSHVAVASHGVSFGLTEVRIGMWPFFIYESMVRAIGERRTLEMSLTGRIFQLPEAVQWGLISEAVPAIELDDRATAIAHHLSESSPQAIAAGLAFAAEANRLEAAPRYRLEAFTSQDFKEGVSALREKRKPSWSTD